MWRVREGVEMKPLLYDVYSGAGGAAKGYMTAGFRVIGVDSETQLHYCGDGFIQMDAFEFFERYRNGEYEQAAAFHASPPCQFYSVLTPSQISQEEHRANHVNLIPPTRDALKATGVPFVIENVPGAKTVLDNPIRLCGSSFGLPIQRHRYFEVPWMKFGFLPVCVHPKIAIVPSGHTNHRINGKRAPGDSAAAIREAMGIDWMSGKELSQAIPPAYTEFIGKQLLQTLNP